MKNRAQLLNANAKMTNNNDDEKKTKLLNRNAKMTNNNDDEKVALSYQYRSSSCRHNYI